MVSPAVLPYSKVTDRKDMLIGVPVRDYRLSEARSDGICHPLALREQFRTVCHVSGKERRKKYMNTLFLNCQDPCSPMRAPWHAFASFDCAVGRNLDVWFDMPYGRLKILVIAHDVGGVVAANGKGIPIDSWEDTVCNSLRLRCSMGPVQAATAAEGLSRLAPLLEAVGGRREVTECLIKNL